MSGILLDMKGLAARLRRDCEEIGGQGRWAEKHNVSPQYVCDVIAGRREPGPAILKGLGVRRVLRYEPV